MKITNYTEKIKKDIAIGDIVLISVTKYEVYEIGEKSVKIKAIEEKIQRGLKVKDFINNNTFAKRYFWNGWAWAWITKMSIPNMDYV